MNKKEIENLTLESYENEFSFKEKKSNLNISFNRIAFIFFIFLTVCLIYSIKVFYLGSLNSKILQKKIYTTKANFRADIVDNNGNFIAKSVNTLTVGINPNLIIDEKRLLINLKLIFPNKDFSTIKKKIRNKKYFRLQRGLRQDQVEVLRHLGDKSIKFEEQITRIYPQQNLFSHIIGQIDDENNGISGIEKFFDYELKKRNKPLELTVDTDIQFLIREELIKFQKIFYNIGSATILMNVNNGDILSMVSLPDFNLNERKEIKEVKYINRVTKGVYELGSVFKTFTIASGLNEEVIEPETEFIDLPKSITCAGRPIREYDNKIPSDLTVEQILIRSGNIGSIRIAQKVGMEKFKAFLENIGVLNKIEFDIEEVGQPIPFRWGKCKLATASFGHGITTTPLQLAKAYAILGNGGYKIEPTILKKEKKRKNKQIISSETSHKINSILRKIVLNKEGTANFANIEGFDVAGKTGTALKSINGNYTKKKLNTFVSLFPSHKPRYVFLVILDEPKPAPDFVYEFPNGYKHKGENRNTSGWNTVVVAGKIIEKIGPILAINNLQAANKF